MNADGTGQRKLADKARFGGWSPDGHLISFVSERNGNWDVYVINADGSGLRNLTRSAAPEWSATLSPDERKIAFVRSPDHSSTDIYVMNADGSGKRRLVRDAGWLAWSPPQRR
jgi:Tol biopolymer transport system component